jgi:hypothetical protein
MKGVGQGPVEVGDLPWREGPNDVSQSGLDHEKSQRFFDIFAANHS